MAKTFGSLAAILACCGVKILLLASLLAPAGFLTGRVALAAVGVVLAVALVVVAAARRRRCDGTCHVPGTDRTHAHSGSR